MGRCCSFWPLVIKRNSYHTMENPRRPITNPLASSALSKRDFRHIASVMQLWLGEMLHFVGSEAGGDLAQPQAFARHVDYGKIRDDGVHAFDGGERIRAAHH